MLQNLVNLKPITPIHGEKLSAKTGQEQTEQGFGQLLNKGRSNREDGEVLQALGDAVEVPPSADGIDDDAGKFGNVGVKTSIAETDTQSLESGQNPQNEIIAMAEFHGGVGDAIPKSELFNLVEAGTVLKAGPDIANEAPAIGATSRPAGIGMALGKDEVFSASNISGKAAVQLMNPRAQQVSGLAADDSPFQPTEVPAKSDTPDVKPVAAMANGVGAAAAPSVGHTDAKLAGMPVTLGAAGALGANALQSTQKPANRLESALRETAEALKDSSIKSTNVETLVNRADKELPRAASQLRGAAEAQIETTKFDRDSLTQSTRAAEVSSVKGVNDQGMANLGQPAQTLISVVRENSNWSKMLTAPTVQFTESVKPNGKVLQALNVTLNPVELGKLELNLRMQQGQVTIEVRAESDQAYRALLVDQDTLANTLRGLGFKVDAITINGPQSENSPQFQNSGQADGEGAAGKFEGEASSEDRHMGDDFGNSSMGEAKSDEENTSDITVI